MIICAIISYNVFRCRGCLIERDQTATAAKDIIADGADYQFVNFHKTSPPGNIFIIVLITSRLTFVFHSPVPPVTSVIDLQGKYPTVVLLFIC